MSIVKVNELLEKGLFQQEKKDAEVLEGVLKRLQEEYSDLLKTVGKGIKLIDADNAKSINDLNTEIAKAKDIITKLNNVKKTQAKFDTEATRNAKAQTQAEIDAEKIRREKLKTQREELRNKQQLDREEKRLNKEREREARINEKLNSSYSKLSKRLNEQRKRYKDLVIDTGRYSKESRKARREVFALDKQLKSIDKSAGQFQRNVGNYFRSFASAIGITAGLAGLARVLRGAGETVIEYEQQNATLAGVLNKTAKEIENLTNQQLALGGATEFTATEVGKLQENFARLGFDPQEIEGLTQSTLDLASALRSDLGETAELVGATINAFGLGTEDTQRVVDSLTKSTQKSALNFQRLKEALGFVAPTAKTLGLSLEETTGILGVLVDNGIKASRAGRLLSTSFLKLSSEGKTLEDALNQINKAQEQGSSELEVAALASKIFGKESAALGIILADNRDKVADLTKEIENSNGATEAFAKTQRETLGGALKILGSAWEKFILDLNNSSDASSSLNKIITFLAKNLTTIIKGLGFAVVAFGAYKTALIASSVATRVAAASSTIFRIATIALSGGIRNVTRAFKLFTKALNINPFILLGTAIVGIVGYLATLNKSLSETVEETQKASEEFLKQREESEKLTDELSTLNERYKELKEKTELTKDEQKELNDIIKIIAKNVPDATTEINKYGDALDISSDKTEEFIKLQKEVNGLKTETEIAKQEKAINRLNIRISRFNKLGNEQNTVFVEGLGLVRKNGEELEKVRDIQGKYASGLRVVGKLTKEEKLLFKSKLLDLEKQRRKSRDLIKELDGTADSERKLAEERKKQQTEGITKKTTKELKELAKAQSDLGKLAQAELDRRKDLNDKRKEEISTLQSLKTQLKDVKKEKELILKTPEDALSPKFIELEERAISLKKEIKALQEALNGDSIDKQREDFELKEEQEITDGIINELKEREQVKNKFNEDLANAEDKAFQEQLAENDRRLQEQLDQEKANAEARAEVLRIIAERKEANEKATYEAINSAAEGLAQAEQFRSQQRIQRINDEIGARENQANLLRGLAENSSQSAIDNLAFENKKIAELQRERQAEEQRAKKIELGLAAIKSYVAGLESGQSPIQALGSTTGGITALLSFINSLPGFYEGTENVSQDLAGNKFSNGKDGYLVRLDGEERVIKGSQNAMLGNLSNDELANLGSMYNNGLIGVSEIAPMINVNSQVSTKGIEKAIERGVSNIKIPSVKTGYEYDQLENIITEVITSDNFVKHIKRKVRFND